MAHVEELTIELVKGPGGFGMDITDSGHVVGNTAGGVAEAAGARHPRARLASSLQPILSGSGMQCVQGYRRSTQRSAL